MDDYSAVIHAKFATESDDKFILDGLAHLAMKPIKNVHDYIGLLNKTNTIMMDAYETYEILLAEPTGWTCKR